MKAVTRVYFFDDDGDKFFGEGPARLMHAIMENGSLRLAALSMGMAYTKALRLIRQTEKALGVPVIIRTTGGKGGGGSILTEEGECWLRKYEAYRDACTKANQEIYRKMFAAGKYGNAGCVIMASGTGTRFGGNKLMADFMGKPLITRIMDATEGCFEKRVVVTRHAEVAEIAEKYGMEVVLHDLPHRNDTVRLGIEAVGDVDSCVFCPGDQPLLSRTTVEKLLQNSAECPENIWRACSGGTPGSPVLFPKWTFPELADLPEGSGGSWLIKKYPERVSMLDIEDPHELMDADTPEALAELLKFASK